MISKAQAQLETGSAERALLPVLFGSSGILVFTYLPVQIFERIRCGEEKQAGQELVGCSWPRREWQQVPVTCETMGKKG